MKYLLAFSGRKQAGKDTLGSFLINNKNKLFGYEFDTNDRDLFSVPVVKSAKKYGWADFLKRIIGDLFNVPDELLWGTDDDKNSLTSVYWGDLPHWRELRNVGDGREHGYSQCLTVRELLQQFGTEIVRNMYRDAWVTAAMKQVKRDNLDLAVFTDTRFPNEVEAIKNAGGKVIRLTRKETEQANHKSEVSLDPDKYSRINFDWVIDNENMSLIEQEECLVNLLKSWRWVN